MTLFERIIAGEIPSNIIYEDDTVIAFLDIAQSTKGHTLVVPKIVTESVLTADDTIIADVNIKAAHLSKQLMAAFNAQGVNILTNANEVAGQTVNHYHVHIIPRYHQNEMRLITDKTNYDLKEVHQEFISYLQTQ